MDQLKSSTRAAPTTSAPSKAPINSTSAKPAATSSGAKKKPVMGASAKSLAKPVASEKASLKAGRKHAPEPAAKSVVKPAAKRATKLDGKSKVAAPAAVPLKTEAARATKALVAPIGGIVAIEAKQKLVRDSFTMPRADFDLVHQLKEKALKFHRPAKKSELLRAGLHALAGLSDIQLRHSLDSLTPLKAGRPKKA